MKYWLGMLSSPQAFDRHLTAAQREAVFWRGKETLWLLGGCIAARAKGCSIRIDQLDVTSHAQDLIRAQFQIDGFSRIESVFDGMIAYRPGQRSEEHTSELQSLMRISYAVFCLKKKNNKLVNHNILNL